MNKRKVKTAVKKILYVVYLRYMWAHHYIMVRCLCRKENGKNRNECVIWYLYTYYMMGWCVL